MSRACCLFVFLVGLSWASGSEAADENPVYTVPTETCRGYFFIPLTLAPQENTPTDRTLWFLFDTGAGATYVDPESLQRVTNRRFKVGKKINLTNATAGPVNIKKMQANIMDLDHLSHALGREIDGGAASASLVVFDLNKFELVSEPRPTSFFFGLDDREYRYSARAQKNAQIGAFELVTPILQSTKDTELIGGQVLQHFILTFDQAKERVKLVQFEAATPIIFEPIMGHGIILNTKAEGFQVVGTLANTPASHSSLAKGDLITEWNGESAVERGCDEITEHDEVLVLGIMHDGQFQEIELQLFPLVD